MLVVKDWRKPLDKDWKKKSSTVAFGGGWNGSSFSGSDASDWSSPRWFSNKFISPRGQSEHLKNNSELFKTKEV